MTNSGRFIYKNSLFVFIDGNRLMFLRIRNGAMSQINLCAI